MIEDPDINTLIEATRDEMDRNLREYSEELPGSLIEIGKWALSSPGKVMAYLRGGNDGQIERPPRWPLCVLLSYLAAADEDGRKEWRAALPAAVAVEIAMAAADLLDELTDDDPSDVVARYGREQALNTGNLMLVMAQQVLARYPAGEGGERASKALLALQGMLVEAATGQHLDLLHGGVGVWQVSLETSAKITALKAGALLSGACRVGAVMAGANEDIVEVIARFGREAGAIAQIENDIGDVMPEGMGEEGGGRKAEGSVRKTDIALRKPTMPIVFTLRAEEEEPNALQQAYSQPVGAAQDEEALRQAIVEAGGVQFGRLLIDVHRRNAQAALEDLEGLRPGAGAILGAFLPSTE